MPWLTLKVSPPSTPPPPTPPAVMNLLGVLRNFNVEQFGWQSVDHPLALKGLLHPTKRAEAVLADDESVSLAEFTHR